MILPSNVRQQYVWNDRIALLQHIWTISYILSAITFAQYVKSITSFLAEQIMNINVFRLQNASD
jgi:hypothetical protein